jgi:hypothetical protein
MPITRKTLARLGFLAALLFVARVHATLIEITVDTSSILGANATMYFDFTNGDPSVTHSVEISAFASDGTLGASNSTPGVAGTFDTPPGTVALSEQSPPEILTTYAQDILLGASFTFQFQIIGTADQSAGYPDAFALSLFDAGTFDPLLSSTGFLFVYSIGNQDPFTEVSDAVTITPLQESPGVPEPGALALAMTALLMLGIVRSARRPSFRRKLSARPGRITP